MRYIDPTGFDYISLNDPSRGFKQGHNAGLVGDNEDGWGYYSKDGYNNPSRYEHFDTYDDYQKAKPELGFNYPREERIVTTKEDDEQMRRAAERILGRPYSISQEHEEDDPESVLSENCADLQAGIGQAGGVNIDNPQDSFMGKLILL